MTSYHTSSIEYDEAHFEASPASEAGPYNSLMHHARMPASTVLGLAAMASILTSGVTAPADFDTFDSRISVSSTSLEASATDHRVTSLAQARQSAIATLLEAERRRSEFVEAEAKPTAIWEDPE